MTPTIKLPPTLKHARRGACVPAAVSVINQLVQGRDFVIEGYVSFAPGHLHEHTWMEVNGIHFDPTFEQFRVLKGFKRTTAIYIPMKVMSVEDYTIETVWAMSPFWINRLREFGVR